MTLYEIILNNSEYLELTKEIEKIKFITDGKWDWEHGLGHYKRVAFYIKCILEQLPVDNRMIELGMAAALLHDIGLSKSGSKKIDHAFISSQLFHKFLINTNVTLSEKNMLEHAIADHSNGNDIKCYLDLALVLADKLDVTYHRTINSSIQDEMNREIQKIKKVEAIINDSELIINYISVGNLNIDILMGWEKMFVIPEKIANYLNKKYVLMINNKLVDTDFVKQKLK